MYPNNSARSRSRNASLAPEIERPSNSTRPSSGCNIPAIKLRSVVFPEPLEPLSAKCCPLSILKEETSINLCIFPWGVRKDFLSWSICNSNRRRIYFSWQSFKFQFVDRHKKNPSKRRGFVILPYRIKLE